MSEEVVLVNDGPEELQNLVNLVAKINEDYKLGVSGVKKRATEARKGLMEVKKLATDMRKLALEKCNEARASK
jgi:hypothetical protein